MAKDVVLHKVTKASEIEGGVTKAKARVKALGLEVTIKAPDLQKVGQPLEKAKKGEFLLTADTDFAKVVFHVGSMTTALGVQDLRNGKREDRLKTYAALVKEGALDKSAVAALKFPDDKDVYASLESIDDVARAGLTKEFRAFATRLHFEESLDFLVAVAKKTPRDEIVEEFIRANAPSEINIDASLRDAIVGGSKEPSDAVPAIKELLKMDSVPKFRKAMQAK